MTVLVPIFLIVLGVVTRTIAIITLRGNFSTQIERPLCIVTTGIYRWMRHPSYTASIIAAIGLGWLASSFGMGLIIGWLMFLHCQERAEREEALLLYWYHAEYEGYRKRTKMFIPFVY